MSYQHDPAYLAGDAVHRLAEAIAELRKVASTDEGARLLTEDFVTIRAAERELRELAQRVTLSALDGRAA